MCYLTENLKYEFVNKTQVYKHLFEKNFIGCNIFHVQFSVTPNNDSAQPHQHNNTVFKGQVLVFWNFLVFILTISDFFLVFITEVDTRYAVLLNDISTCHNYLRDSVVSRRNFESDLLKNDKWCRETEMRCATEPVLDSAMELLEEQLVHYKVIKPIWLFGNNIQRHKRQITE